MRNEGFLIKEYRKKNGITQEAFGKRLGVSKQTVSKWEKGTLVPSLAKCFEIADILGIPPEALTSESDDKESPALVYKKRIPYDVGLNTLYLLVHDFLSFAFFIDAFASAREFVSPADEPAGYQLIDQTIDDAGKDEAIPIRNLYYDSENVIIETANQYMMVLSEKRVSRVEQASCFNNEAYSFLVYLQNDEGIEEHFLQLVICFQFE